MSAPKTPDRLRNRSRLRKLECFACPPDGRTIAYMSRANVAANGAPRCGRCGDVLLLSDLADCADVQPEHVDSHPLGEDVRTRELRAALADELATRGDCNGCGRRMPAAADPDYWRCAGCGTLHTRDGIAQGGGMSGEKVRAGGAEHETAIGRRCEPRAQLPRINYPANAAAARILPARRPAETKAHEAIPF